MEEQLISFVERNRFLFDKDHKNYGNVRLRNKKFAELEKKLNIPVRKLKDRWRTLRDKFNKEIKYGPTSQLSKWKWMDRLSFLTDVDIDSSLAIGDLETFDPLKVSGTEENSVCDLSTITEGTPLHLLSPKKEKKIKKKDVNVSQSGNYKQNVRQQAKETEKPSNAQNAPIKPSNAPIKPSNVQIKLPVTELDENMSDCEKCDRSSLSEEIPLHFIPNMRNNAKKPNIIDMKSSQSPQKDNCNTKPQKAKDTPKTITVPQKASVDLFFGGLAQQTRDAQLTSLEFTSLQIDLLQTFKIFLTKSQK